MGQLYIPSERSISGPWLLGTDELEDLSEVFEFVSLKLTESTNKEFEEISGIDLKNNFDLDIAILKNKAINGYKKVKVVTLTSSDGSRLTDASIMSILKDPRLKDFKPEELILSVEDTYTNRFSLSIQRNFIDKISYKLDCFDQECREEIKYRIDKWLNKNQPNKVKQFWREYAILLAFISLITISLFASSIFTFQVPDFKTTYKKDINQIINSGVNKDNEAKSIELLLKYTTDYKPENVKGAWTINELPLRIVELCAAIFVISAFKPKTTIGLGKDKPLLQFYKWYIKFVLIILPSIFIVPPLLEWIKSLL